jgi:tetratricopeptide (TPR) repeat protein
MVEAVGRRSGRLLAVLGLVAVVLAAYDFFLHRRLAGREGDWQRLQAQSRAVDPLPALVSLATLPDAARARAPELYEAAGALAAQAAQEGDAAAAEAALRRAAERARGSASPALVMGLFFRARGRYDLALTEFARGREAAPLDAQLPLQEGLTYFSMGKRREAEARFQAALALDPVLSDAWLGLAYLHNTPAARPQAIAEAQRFCRLRPRASEGHALLARLDLDAGQPAQALAEGRAATQARPADYAAWFALGTAQAATGDVAGAIKSLARAAALNPSFAPAQFELGRLSLQQGRREEALRALGAAVALAPDSGEYRWTLAQALRQQGDRETADREARAAAALLAYDREQKRLTKRIQDHPGEVSYYEELAALHLDHGRPERALPVLQTALARTPGSPRLQELLQRASKTQPAPPPPP